MKKKQIVRDIVSDCSCNVLKITSNGHTLDSRTMDNEAQIFDGLLDLKVKNINIDTHKEYCSWDDSAGWHNKIVLKIEVEYKNK